MRWKNSEDIGLLWIKGGAGKGKTMMSIGLIEELSDQSSVLYFFCQRDNHELNTIEAIIKGLIKQLVDRKEVVKSLLRRLWNESERRLYEDVNSWQSLWCLFKEMLDMCLPHNEKCSCSQGKCSCRQIFVVVDALDECVDNYMAAFLETIVKTGLDHPKQVKWLLTSRLFDSGERTLVADFDQLHISLELNSAHIAQAVRNYIVYKVTKLDHTHRYGDMLCRRIEESLSRMPDDTFLWVSLVCQKLETVESREALDTIQNSPSTLVDLYDEAYKEICYSESSVTDPCLQLLWGMVHAFRPLRTYELSNVLKLPDDLELVKKLVRRCSSFILLRDTVLEFIHQSARDYLVGTHPEPLDQYSNFIGHQEMGYRCLYSLRERLQSRSLSSNYARDAKESELEIAQNDSSLFYPVSFWFQHVYAARGQSIIVKDPLGVGQVGSFIQEYLLQWFHYLSLLNELPLAIEVLETLTESSTSTNYVGVTLLQNFLENHMLTRLSKQTDSHLMVFVKDAKRFLLQHYQTILLWPQQIFCIATVFEPRTSVVRQKYLDRYPPWLNDQSYDETTERSRTDLGLFPYLTFRCEPEAVRILAISWDSQVLALGCSNKVVEICTKYKNWSREKLHSSVHDCMVIAISSNGRWVAMAGEDDKFEIHKLVTPYKRILRGRLKGHKRKQILEATKGSRTMTRLFVSDDKRWIALVANNDIIGVWDLERKLSKRTKEQLPQKGRDLLDDPPDVISEQNAVTFENVTTLVAEDLHAPFAGRSLVFASFEGEQLYARVDNFNRLELWGVSRQVVRVSHPTALSRLFGGKPTISLHPRWEIEGHIPLDQDFMSTGANDARSGNENVSLNERLAERQNLQNLSLYDQWICYGERRVLLLPDGFNVRCFVSSEDHIALGCEDGRVLLFAFDCSKLVEV